VGGTEEDLAKPLAEVCTGTLGLRSRNTNHSIVTFCEEQHVSLFVFFAVYIIRVVTSKRMDDG
jgi:hypothetical protein